MDFSQSVEDIQNEILDGLDPNYEKRKGFFLWDISKAFAIVLSKVLSKLTDVCNRLDLENLKGDELEKFILQRTGIERKQSTYARGVLSIKGNGTVLKGAIFETEGLVRFESVEEVAINGEGKVNIKAVSSGNIGNIVAGAIVKIPITIQGIVSCVNEEETSGGYEAEEDGDLRIRYYEKLRTPSTSGNIYHYKQWAKDVNGVGDAKVFPLWNGNNTVKVVIIDNNRQPASDTLVEEVQNYIDPNSRGKGEGEAPIGAFCNVVSARRKEIDINVRITREDSFSVEVIKQGIRKELINYCSSLAFRSNVLSYAIVGARILNVEGVLDYSNLLINAVSSNIECLEDEVFVIGEVVIS